MSKKYFSILFISLGLVILQSCEPTKSGTSSNNTSNTPPSGGFAPFIPLTPSKKLTALNISSAPVNIGRRSTYQFTATGIYSDGSTENFTSSVAWDSSNKNVASITLSGGLVTTTNYGVTNITATLNGVKSNPVALSVIAKYAYVANTYDNTLSIYSFNPSDGSLTYMSKIEFGLDIGDITIDPSGKYLYAINSNENVVNMYSLNSSTGQLTPLDFSQVNTGINPSAIAITPNGKFVYVTNTDTDEAPHGTISLYSLDPKSGLLSQLDSLPVDTGKNPSAIITDPQGKFAYVVNSLSSTISYYSIDQNLGTLKLVNDIPMTSNPPSDIAIHPSGKFAYVTSESGVVCFTIDEDGGLSNPDKVSAGLSPQDITIHSSGNFAYVTNYGDGQNTSTVSMYSIDPNNNGQLTPMKPERVSAGMGPWGITIEPSGKYAYVANWSDTSISFYSINPTSGILTAQKSTTGASNPLSIKFF